MKNINCFASTRGLLSAFTLAEMMVVMLILSIVLAAMAPVMTTRNKPNNSSPWQYEAQNRKNAYFGAGANMYAMIGKQVYDETWGKAKLLIATGTDDTDMLAFMNNDAKLGRLYIGSNNGLLLGLITDPIYPGEGTVAIGRLEKASGKNSVVIGRKAKNQYENAIAIGYQATAKVVGSDYDSSGAIAIGANSEAKYSNSIAIGNTAKSGGYISDGSDSGKAISIGYNTNSVVGSIAVGPEAKANNTYSVAIGRKAEAQGVDSIAIGVQTTVQNKSDSVRADNSIAVGRISNVKIKDSVAIGYKAIINESSNVNESGLIAVGRNVAMTDANRSIAIGADVVVKGNNAFYDASGPRYDYDHAVETVAIGYKTNAINANRSVIIGSNSKVEATVSPTIVGVPDSNSLWVDSDKTNLFGGVAIGYKALSIGRDGYSVAVGHAAYAGNGSTAIGSAFYGDVPYKNSSGNWVHSTKEINQTIATGSASTAIGPGAKVVNQAFSTAIGANAKAEHSHQIVLGTEDETVYIPGRLIVGHESFFGQALNTSGSNKVSLAGLWGNGGTTGFLGDGKGGGNFDVYGASIRYDLGTDYNNILEYIKGMNTSSDRRLKYVGKENTSGLDKIRQLKVFNYTYKKDTTKTPHVGVIAQDLQKVFPDAVKKGADGFLTIRMEDMFFAVINAIKELDAKYQAQEKRITALEKENKEFKARLDRLEAKTK